MSKSVKTRITLTEKANGFIEDYQLKHQMDTKVRLTKEQIINQVLEEKAENFLSTSVAT